MPREATAQVVVRKRIGVALGDTEGWTMRRAEDA